MIKIIAFDGGVGGDSTAAIEGRPETRVASGGNVNGAIGKLIMEYPKIFDVELEIARRPTPSEMIRVKP